MTVRPAVVRVRACEKPPKRHIPAVRRRRLENAIHHARLVCYNYEDSQECRVAWDIVEEMSASEHNLKLKKKKVLLESEDDWEDISHKLYDI